MYAVIRNGIVASVHTEEQEAIHHAKGGNVMKKTPGSIYSQSKRNNTEENKAYRASLHRVKSSYSNHHKRDEEQRKIDAISQRG